jgi:hypothetical protein
MRVFLSLLVPSFLSFAYAHEEYLYSVAWDGAACSEDENYRSLDAIEAAVTTHLSGKGLTAGEWEQQVTYSRRELEQSETQGQRELCHTNQCASACQHYKCCCEMYNCKECGGRQLIQTERVLTHRELEDLQAELVSVCEVALGAQGASTGNVFYTQDCKTAMIEANCNALVYTSEPTHHSGASVCENYAVHAGLVSFAGAVSTIYGGNVGFGKATTGAPKFVDGGGVMVDSDGFAASLLVTLAKYSATHLDEVPMSIEIGSQKFTPGFYRSGSAINIAFGSDVTLDGKGDYVFIAGTTLTTAADTKIILTNGAKAEDVIWALGTAAILGANSVVEGSILAGTAITFGNQSELHGCALAQTKVHFESGGIIDAIYD